MQQIKGEPKAGKGGCPPIFRSDSAEYSAFYAPGCLCVVGRTGADRFQAQLEAAGPGAEAPDSWASQLQSAAASAIQQVHARLNDPFGPECLTLYLNNECNLNCIYCYSEPSTRPAERLGLAAIASAAQVVAASCREKGLPFTMALHGGGEPTLDRGRVDAIMDLVEEIADGHGIAPYCYVATNGLLSEEKARWLAQRFDLVGISCDGPPEIHNQQRPRWDGGPSHETMARTGRILHEEGCGLHVRTTITPQSVRRQEEIARYLCQRFAPSAIHFEPIYSGGRATEGQCLRVQDADEFASGFLAAKRVALSLGVPLSGSGSRLDTIHGAYCHVYRHTLNLVPGGCATACFKLTTAKQVGHAGACIGQVDRESGHYILDHDRLHTLRRELDASRPECVTCFNRYHCTRGCPDTCPLDSFDRQNAPAEPGFRCRSSRAIAAGILAKTAERLWAECAVGGQEGPHGTREF